MWMGRTGVRFMEEGRKWRLHVVLYVDGLVLFGQSEEDLKVIVGRLLRWGKLLFTNYGVRGHAIVSFYCM